MIAALEVNPPARPRMVDARSYVSPSRLNLWLKCPLAFRLRYVDGIESPASQALLVGKRVHSGLEYYYRHRQVGVELSSEEVCRRLPRLWNSLEGEEVESGVSDELEDDVRLQAMELMQAYVTRLRRREVARHVSR